MTSHGHQKKSEASQATPGPIGFDARDHDQCVETAIAEAGAHCATTGARFTPVRRAALEILLREHRAWGAYELYRALDFLVENGFVHKIERLNAFIACAHPAASHSPAFLICRKCDAVAEAHSAPARGTLGEAAKATGFKIERTVVEALGVCQSCAETSET